MPKEDTLKIVKQIASNLEKAEGRIAEKNKVLKVQNEVIVSQRDTLKSQKDMLTTLKETVKRDFGSKLDELIRSVKVSSSRFPDLNLFGQRFLERPFEKIASLLEKFEFKLPKEAKDAIPVRLSNGKEFYEAITQVFGGGGGGGGTPKVQSTSDSNIYAVPVVNPDGSDISAGSGWITARARYTSAQTNTAIVSASAGQTIVVKNIKTRADNANLNDTGFIIGFDASTTPTGEDALDSHPGVAAGSGTESFFGDTGIASQTTGDDLLITSENPGGNFDVLVVYKII